MDRDRFILNHFKRNIPNTTVMSVPWFENTICPGGTYVTASEIPICPSEITNFGYFWSMIIPVLQLVTLW